MKIDKIPWWIEPHTEVKHEILKKYLQPWMVILSKGHKRLIYLDGFAGPGEYLNNKGELVDGSPVIAIKSFIEHKLKNKVNEIVYIFVEENPKIFNYLNSKIKTYKDLGVKIEIINDKFENVVNHILDNLEKEGKNIAPTFCFIDPFGIKGVPLSTISRIMNKKSCEVFINFMYEELDRFITLKGNENNINALFGEENEWKKVKDIKDPKEKYLFLTNLYQKRLQDTCGRCYIRTFDMINKFNKTDYVLFFCTKIKLGLVKMKEAMWKIDESGNFIFSDATFDLNQKLLFEKEPNYKKLKEMILTNYKGKSLEILELIDFVEINTPFLESHLRKPILYPMEINNEIEIIFNGKRKKEQYPPGSVIKFL